MQRTALITLDLIKLIACLGAIEWLWQGKWSHQSKLSWSAVAVFICLLPSLYFFHIFFSDTYNNFNDFRNAYYPAGVAVLTDPAELGPLLGRAKFVNLPIVAYLFAPFALFSLPVAAAIFTVLGLAAVVWAWALLCRLGQLDDRASWLLLGVFAGFGPLIYSFKEANMTHVVLPAILIALVYLREHKDAAAGLILGACSVIKLPLLLFGGYFVLRRNWPAVVSFAAVWVVASIASFVVFGWDLNRQWFEFSVLQSSSNVVGAYNMQSIAGFIARLTNDVAIVRDWVPYPPSVAARLLALAIILSLIGAAIWVCAKDRTDDLAGGRRDLEYCLVVALAVVSSPLSWVHYYSWFLIPMAFFISPRPAIPMEGRELAAAWLGIILMAPMVLYPNLVNQVALWLYAKIAVSHTLFGGLIFVLLLIWVQARSGSARVRSPIEVRSSLSK